MNFLVPSNKCKVGGLIVENFDQVLLVLTLFALVLVLLLVVLAVALIGSKKCKCICDKKLDEIMERQNVLSTSLSTRRVMDARNIANERVAQNARVLRAIDTMSTRLDRE